MLNDQQWFFVVFPLLLFLSKRRQGDVLAHIWWRLGRTPQEHLSVYSCTIPKCSVYVRLWRELSWDNIF